MKHVSVIDLIKLNSQYLGRRSSRDFWTEGRVDSHMEKKQDGQYRGKVTEPHKST